MSVFFCGRVGHARPKQVEQITPGIENITPGIAQFRVQALIAAVAAVRHTSPNIQLLHIWSHAWPFYAAAAFFDACRLVVGGPRPASAVCFWTNSLGSVEAGRQVAVPCRRVWVANRLRLGSGWLCLGIRS